MQRQRLCRIVAWSFAALVGLIVISPLISFPPHGRFIIVENVFEDDAYFEAANGEFCMVTVSTDEAGEKREYRHLMGEYKKKGEHWVLQSPSGRVGRLEANLYRLELTGPDGMRTKHYRYEIFHRWRRWLPDNLSAVPSRKK